jgi:hypothetical protein
MRNFINKHILLTDFIACLMTYVLLGGTLVALVAAAWLGITISISLALLNEPVTAQAIMKGLDKLEEVKNSALKALKDALGEENGNSKQPEIKPA